MCSSLSQEGWKAPPCPPGRVPWPRLGRTDPHPTSQPFSPEEARRGHITTTEMKKWSTITNQRNKSSQALRLLRPRECTAMCHTCAAIVWASCAATVVFPTPPLPLRTRTMCLTCPTPAMIVRNQPLALSPLLVPQCIHTQPALLNNPCNTLLMDVSTGCLPHPRTQPGHQP